MSKYEGLNRQLEMAGATMTEFARFLATTHLRTVIDRTGLSGMFDVSLRWTSCPAPGPGSADLDTPGNAPECNGGPSLFTAISDQLGLKLAATNGPVQILVIDHVEKPSEN